MTVAVIVTGVYPPQLLRVTDTLGGAENLRDFFSDRPFGDFVKIMPADFAAHCTEADQAWLRDLAEYDRRDDLVLA